MVSVATHGTIAALAIALYFVRLPDKTQIEFEVIEHPVESPKALNIIPPKPETKPVEPPKPKHEVFGISRKALTDETSGGESVKLGNTVATQPDNKKLGADDPDSLPIPTDEYLVTSMPQLLSDVRIAFPPDAKARGVSGPVVMDLLIDQDGNVREAQLISGPDERLNNAALGAAKGFRFRPAKVETKTVAVRIRYTYRFVLEK
jgi:protein TonB